MQTKIISRAILVTLGLNMISPALASDQSTTTTNNITSLSDFIDQTSIDGDIRSYYFVRNYSDPDAINQQAYSLGGDLRLLTAPFLTGFQVGVAFYTAQALGTRNDNPNKIDKTLMGLDESLNVVGQAYLQYSRPTFLIRGGDQVINTPWMNASDSRMIPAAFRGFYGTWNPVPTITLTALRMFEYKSRIADNFSATNDYNPDNAGVAIEGVGDHTDDGALAFGANYKTPSITAELWGYQFYDYAKMLYGDAQYTFYHASPIHPFIGVQGLGETGDGDNILDEVSTGEANSTALGALAGVEGERARFTVGYNKVFSGDGFNDGGIVSPYTAGYASDPLYTTSMIAGLVEKAPGDAVKVTGTYYAFQKQLTTSLSFAQYDTQPFVHDTNETDLDVTYAFNNRLKGFSIRNRLGVQNGDPTKGTFCYERLMLQYSF